LLPGGGVSAYSTMYASVGTTNLVRWERDPSLNVAP
jgi:hypothetical protein